MKKEKNTIPNYSLSEELINSISHGVGGALSICCLVLMLIKANSPLEYITCTIFGTTMITLYTISSVYHGLSSKIKAKKVLRILDHCNVYMLVFGTYFPVALLGISGIKGIILISFVGFITILGITLTCININKYQIVAVILHLINGWSALIGIKELYTHGFNTPLFIILGGLMYSIGAILYGIGTHKKYMHSIFHFFCLAGTLFHFLAIYLYIL